jgi:unsaturated rhamnogalacturonyl hydrolase
MVALDCYHNNEPSPHYTWSLTAMGGFSQLAGIVLNAGGDTMSIRTAFDSAVLAPADLLIIVDPDTTTEAPGPKYLSAAEINAVDAWVQRGGVLMLLANNFGNCELTQISALGARFGIRFNADTYGSVYDLTPLPSHVFFTGCDILFIKDICTLTLSSPATAVFTLGGKVIMATSTKGTGTVFALGDPWLYNEYINTRDNFRAGTNVIQWLLSQVPSVAVRRDPSSDIKTRRSGRARRTAWFLPNGKMIDPSANASGLLIRRLDNTKAEKKPLIRNSMRHGQ